MKMRRFILLLCFVSVLLLTLLWYGNQIRRANWLGFEATNATGLSTASTAPASGPTSTTSGVQVPPRQTTGPLSTYSRRQKLRQALDQYNTVPIVFYGKLEDQFGAPVPGAVVSVSVQVLNVKESGLRHGQVVSDAGGFFTISGYKGQNLTVSPKKRGYDVAAENCFFNYSQLFPDEEPFQPDPNRPVLIKMWKLQGAQPLVNFDFKTYIPLDGTPVAFNLLTGQRGDHGGDLSIRVQSPTEPDLRAQYDWTVTISSVYGGVIEESRFPFEMMYEAPESGYTNEFIIKYQKGIRPWVALWGRGFYFTSRDHAIYGKFRFDINTAVVKKGAVPITLRGFLNPAGSRNLEMDEHLITPAHP